MVEGMEKEEVLRVFPNKLVLGFCKSISVLREDGELVCLSKQEKREVDYGFLVDYKKLGQCWYTYAGKDIIIAETELCEEGRRLLSGSETKVV